VSPPHIVPYTRPDSTGNVRARNASGNASGNAEVLAVDVSTWLDEDQAAAAIGVDPRSVRNYAAAGRLTKARWRKPEHGARERTVYHPDDVRRVAREEAERKKPKPPQQVLPGEAVALARVDPNRFLEGTWNSGNPSWKRADGSDKPFLTVAEAAAFTTLSQPTIKRLIADGSLTSIADRRGEKIARKVLDELV